MIRQIAVIKFTKNNIQAQIPQLLSMRSTTHKKRNARWGVKIERYRPKKKILRVTCRYAGIDDLSITSYDICPGGYLFDVPYTKWLKHVSQEVDISTWEGTGIGMIGGPIKIDVAALLYDGILSSYSMFDLTIEEIEEEVRRFQRELEDTNYEYAPNVQEQIQEYIRKGKRKIKELKRANQKKK